MPPCNCHPPFPRPEPFSPLPRPGKIPDWGKWIRDRLAEKGALLVFPTRASFPGAGEWPNLYLDLETGAVYRWDREDYSVLVDPREGNDVLVYDSVAAFPDEGEQGKLYIAANTGSLYRWGGEGYVALLEGKADKAVPQTAGNLAELTQDGNLTDSGKKPADFATAAQGTKADTAVQPPDLLGFVDGAAYDAVYGNPPKPTILLKHGATVVATVDATDFVIDGMVSDVKIENGNLVITFNTDSGKQPISIPLTDIFDPANYYDKGAVDEKLGRKLDATEGVLNALGYVYSDWDMSAFPAAFQSSQPQTYHNEVINKYEWVILTGGVVVSDERYDTEADALAALSITLRGPQLPDGAVATRTRTATSYRLGTAGGPNAGKPLQPAGNYATKASPVTAGNLAALDANGNPTDSGVAKSTVESLLFAPQYYPDGSVTSAAEFTQGIKYGSPDTTNRTITVKPFCNTGTAADDNSSLVGRVVIPPFVDASGNGYISDDGTRYKVIEIMSFMGGGAQTNLTAVIAPTTVYKIGNEAFNGCERLVSAVFPAVMRVDGAFNECYALTSLSLPSATYVDDFAFQSCVSLLTVSLPAATNIGEFAFSDCSHLVSALLPSATSIGDGVFSNCSSLTFVDFGDTPRSSVPTLGTDAFYGVPTTCTIIVPDAQYDAWTAASGWSGLVTQGYKFLKHSEWKYARKYEVDKKADKPATFTADNLAALTSDGGIADSGKSLDDISQEIQDAIGYAVVVDDKLVPTEGPGTSVIEAFQSGMTTWLSAQLPDWASNANKNAAVFRNRPVNNNYYYNCPELLNRVVMWIGDVNKDEGQTAGYMERSLVFPKSGVYSVDVEYAVGLTYQRANAPRFLVSIGDKTQEVVGTRQIGDLQKGHLLFSVQAGSGTIRLTATPGLGNSENAAAVVIASVKVTLVKETGIEIGDIVAPDANAQTGQAADAKATGDALAGKLDASNGVATGLVTYLGTINGFDYGLRFGSYGSDYAVQIVARSAGQQASWQATANLMVQKSKTGYAALLSDIPNVPSPSTSAPLMDGTGSAGSSAAFARGDHVHPSDSAKLDKNGPSNRKIQWNAESGFLEVVDQNGLKFIFPRNSFGSAEFAASREYVNDQTPYKLTTKTIDNGAVTLDDRAINAVAVSSALASLTVNFPRATSGKARDFGLRLTVASGITTAPELALPQGVVCENADGEAPEIGADGAATILYFTETASGVFLVKGEVLQTITQA